MQVTTSGQVPDYEIDPKEIDLSNSMEITKVLHFVFFGFLLFPTFSFSFSFMYSVAFIYPRILLFSDGKITFPGNL